MPRRKKQQKPRIEGQQQQSLPGLPGRIRNLLRKAADSPANAKERAIKRRAERKRREQLRRAWVNS